MGSVIAQKAIGDPSDPAPKLSAGVTITGLLR